MKVYPVNLKIADRPCAVIGGGKVAERKILSLLEAGAKVTVISPKLTSALAKLAADGGVCWRNKDYGAGDVQDYFMVVCAADSKAVNNKAAAEARTSGALLNVVDAPDECDFIIPGKISRGDLLITVSTGGKSPAFSRRLREELETRYGEEYGMYLEMLSRQREAIKEKLVNTKDRERFWRAALNSEVLTLLNQGQLKEAEAMIINAISSVGTQS
ncbi:MAG: bifunctional precorrin-2 dehydrogenase/sirohydrochlorin ferrochelatase [Pelosinus sp.]|nr:bifunctional precorrin-2 dehydrogenase/sirohydrochlorin ferrochelatase [Pelosinus sp.]